MSLVPSLNIFQNVRTGGYFLERMVEDQIVRGTYLSYGDLEPIPAETLRDRGLDLLLEEFAEFRRRGPLADPPGKRWKPAEWRRFNRDHLGFGLKEVEDSQLRVTPSTRDTKGERSFPRSLARTVPMPRSNEEFFTLLQEVLQECG